MSRSLLTRLLCVPQQERKRNRSAVPLFVVTLGLVAAPALAHAQSASTYIAGGPSLSHQPGVTGETYQSYVAAPGGTTMGWTVGLGAFIRPRLSVEGELAVSGLMTSRQGSRYGMTFNEKRRDWTVGGHMRFHGPSAGRVSLDGVVGAFVVLRQAWSQTEQHSAGSSPGQPPVVGPRRPADVPNGVGMAAGFDVRIGGPHVALVPSFRVRVATGSSSTAYPGGGIGRWSISLATVLRVAF